MGSDRRMLIECFGQRSTIAVSLAAEGNKRRSLLSFVRNKTYKSSSESALQLARLISRS